MHSVMYNFPPKKLFLIFIFFTVKFQYFTDENKVETKYFPTCVKPPFVEIFYRNNSLK